MDVNDAVGLALLRIGRRDHEAHPQARQGQRRGQQRQHRPDAPSQGVKVLWRGVMKQLHVRSFIPAPGAKPQRLPKG